MPPSTRNPAVEENVGRVREGTSGLIGRLRAIVAIWFFAGMPLSMLLSGIFFSAGIPLPPLLYFLFSLIYLSGSLLGATWSGESLRRKQFKGWEFVGVLFVCCASIGFFYVSIVFAVLGFRRL